MISVLQNEKLKADIVVQVWVGVLLFESTVVCQLWDRYCFSMQIDKQKSKNSSTFKLIYYERSNNHLIM